MAAACAAVVAQGEVALKGPPPGVHRDHQHGPGGVTAEPVQAGLQAPHPAQALQPGHLGLQLGQAQHPALQGEQQVAQAPVQPPIGALHPHLRNPTFHHLQQAGRWVLPRVDARVGVAIGVEPAAEGSGAGLQPGGWILDVRAGSKNRAQGGGVVEREALDLREGCRPLCRRDRGPGGSDLRPLVRGENLSSRRAGGCDPIRGRGRQADRPRLQRRSDELGEQEGQHSVRRPEEVGGWCGFAAWSRLGGSTQVQRGHGINGLGG